MTPCLWLVTQPKPLLSAGIYALIFTGVYSINNDSFDIGIALLAAILGYGLKYFKFPFLPLVLGTILGYMLESSFRRALLMSDNDYSTFVTDPIAGGMMALAFVFVASSIGRSWWVSRKQQQAAA
jgi:putative tricarboxylic transport membrane protein